MLTQVRSIYNDITVLTDQPSPTESSSWPTRQNIESTLEDFKNGASNDDVFLFYYCGGHGGSNKPPPVNPNDPNRQEHLTTLNESHSRPDVLFDTRLNEITAGFPSKCNITFVFHACFSGGMFDIIPLLPHPIRGIALTSVDGTTPALTDNNIDVTRSVDISTIVKKTIRDNSLPTYKELYDEIYSQTAEKGLVMALPNGTHLRVDYEPQMYYNSSFVDPKKAKFLEPFNFCIHNMCALVVLLLF